MAHSSKVLPDPPHDSYPPAVTNPGPKPQGADDTKAAAVNSVTQQLESTDLALDLILHDIAERARQATGASGAAIALERAGSVVCRASAGTTAPDLGVKIDTNSGLSGACLRTGETQWCSDTELDDRVDTDACRQLGVRSIIVVPLFSGSSPVGVFEVFSPRRSAFGEGDLQTLRDLAQWVTEAIQGAGPAAAQKKIAQTEPVLGQARPRSTTALLRTPGWASLLRDRRTGFLRTGVIVLTIALCSLLAFRWGWQIAHSGKPATPVASMAPVTAPQAPASQPQPQNPALVSQIKDSVSAPSKAATAKPTPLVHPGSLVVYDKDGIIYRQTPGKDQAPSQTIQEVVAALDSKSKQSSSTASSAQPPQPGPGPASAAADNSKSAAANAQSAPAIPTTGSTVASLTRLSEAVSPAPVNIPVAPPARISQGVKGGRITHRVDPKYPAQALLRRIEGAVIVDAVIAKEGRLHDVKAVSGNAYLTQAAVDALKQWRYEPYTLNGEPVEMKTTVTMNFNLPK